MSVGQPRAVGEALVSVKRSERGTALDEMRHSGSLKLCFPRSPNDSVTAVLVNTAGGVTGGDRFSFRAHARSGASLTLTTQAAERAYRAQPGEVGRIENTIAVDGGAVLNWLPQETILFDGSAVRRRLTIDAAVNSCVCLAEPLVFGRAAMGETLNQALFRDRIEIRRDGAPLYLDAMSLQGDVAAHLARPNVANGGGAMVSIVYAAPNAESYLDKVRNLLPSTGGASLVQDGLLAARILAADGYDLRIAMIPILTLLSNNTLPRPWMI